MGSEAGEVSTGFLIYCERHKAQAMKSLWVRGGHWRGLAPSSCLLRLLGDGMADLSPARQLTGPLPFPLPPSHRRPKAAWPCAWPWGRPSLSKKCGASSWTTGSVWTPSARWVPAQRATSGWRAKGGVSDPAPAGRFEDRDF